MNIDEKASINKKNKKELLDKLLKSKGIINQDINILRRDYSGPCELSFSQKRIWFLQQYDPKNPSYNIPLAIRIKGELNINYLQRSINEVIKRHDILRTFFPTINGEPVQIVEKELNINLNVEDISSLSTLKKDESFKNICSRCLNEIFDLSTLPLIKAEVVKLDKEEYVLLLCIHHIIADGWSTGIIAREMTQWYSALSLRKTPEIDEMSIQYTDFSYWQKNQDKTFIAEMEYWKKKLEGFSSALEFPKDRSKYSTNILNGAFERFQIDKLTLEKIKKLARENRTTLFVILISIFKIQLYRYTGQDDIIIGTPVAGRNRKEVEALVGLFVNSLALRTKVDGELNFNEFIKNVKETVFGAYSHQELPFEKIVEELKPERSLNTTPIFQVMFSLQNSPMQPIILPGLETEIIDIDTGISQFDLSLTFREENGELKGFFEYNSDVFEDYTIKQMVGHYIRLIEGVLENPKVKISKMTMLTQKESDLIMEEWNRTEEDFPYEKSIITLFEEQVKKSRENTAVIFGDVNLSYEELNKKAQRIANSLIDLGIPSEARVGIYSDYSSEMIAAILGVLKANTAYVPLDPEYPEKRIEFIIKDSQIDVLLVQKALASNINYKVKKIIYIDDLDNDYNIECKRISSESGENKLACVIYTSGSTGQPKGVMLENRGIVNLITSFIRSYNVEESDRVMPLTSIGSASFVGEILPILCAGGSVVLAKKTDIIDYENLWSLVEKHCVSIISTVPSLMNKLSSKIGQNLKLKLILSGGEILSLRDLGQLLKSTKVVNGYGLTETTICSTYHFITEDDISKNNVSVIGKPLMNTKIYILDRYLNCMPIGCPGEIFISGEGIARGYLNNSELTREKFISNPFIQGEKMFRTGDIGCWLKNGTIKYIGRIDNQVKIRGFRIELEEIKLLLEQNKDVTEAAVLFKEDDTSQKRLVAYIVLNRSGYISKSKLSQWLSERVPPYMLPSEYVILESMPLNSNGKIDIKALLELSASKKEEYIEKQQPNSTIEKAVYGVWKEFLHFDTVGIDDNFFDIGGHSLLVMQILDRLKGMFQKKLTVVDMFKYPTIRLLSEYLDNENDAEKKMILSKKLLERSKMQKEMLKRAKNRKINDTRKTNNYK